jgi:outer membrane protein TolC
VESRHAADIGFRVAGRVTRVLVDEGDRVRVGELLAALDAVEYRLGNEAAQADLDRAQDQYTRLKALAARNSVAPADPGRLPAPAPAVGALHLTLDEAIALARASNRGLRIQTLRVTEQERRVAQSRADAFPQVAVDGYYTQTAETQGIVLPTGSLGFVTGVGPIPTRDVTIAQGGKSLFLASATLSQPVTQLIRIRAATRAAAADARVATAGQGKTDLDLVYEVQQLYIEILVATRRRDAAVLDVTAAEARLQDAQAAVSAGTVLPATLQAAQATRLERRQSLLALDNQIDDLRTDLNDMLALPLETALDLAPFELAPDEQVSAVDTIASDLGEHPDVRAATALVDKAEAEVTVARSAYIPELAFFGQYVHQSAVPFLPRDNLVVGLRGSWTVFNFGKREAAIAERRLQLDEARVNADRVRNQVSADVQRSVRKVERTRQMRQVAQEVLVARREAARLQRDQSEVGLTASSEAAQARFDEAQAEADFLAAELEYRLARAELARAVGRAEGRTN